MKYLLSLMTLVLVMGCDNRNSPGTAERSEVDRNDRAELAPSRDESRDDDTTSTQEVVEAPGTVGKTEQETGSATIEGTKKTITTETDKVKESIPTIGTTQHRADINRMDEDDFVALGLSKEQAGKVTDYREKNGDFKSIDDLRKVPGISTSWFNKMKGQLAISRG